MPVYRGTLTLNGINWSQPLAADGSSDMAVLVPAELFRDNAVNVIEIASERMWTPGEVDPGSLDGHHLDVGITGLEFSA